MPTGIWLISFIGLLILLAIETVLVSGMLKQLSSLYVYYVKNDSDSGLSLGMRAPILESKDIFSGKTVSTKNTNSKKMLVFLSTKCSACQNVMAIVPLIAQTNNVEVITIFGAPEKNIRLYFAETWRTITEFDFNVVSDVRATYSDSFKTPYVPYVIVIDEEGFIGAKGMPLSSGEAFTLLRQTDALRNNRLKSQGSVSLSKEVA